MSHKRPEYTPPELYYDDKEASKYTSNSHIIEVQNKLTERALELLALPDDYPGLILDIGCGSGLSGEVLSDNGHYWVGIDISQSMLNIAQESECEGDLILHDMGNGTPFRAGSFDGAISFFGPNIGQKFVKATLSNYPLSTFFMIPFKLISISALQWLCNADKKSHNPIKRISKFFTTLYSVLSRGSKAVFQLYPETPDQLELLTHQAMKAGFTGGVVVDFPNSTKAKKIYLVLFTGGIVQVLPKGLTENDEKSNLKSTFEGRRLINIHKNNDKPNKKSRKWILEKKERQRKQGKTVRPDTKYSGRKRNNAF